jgi:hypothetical protein
MHLLRRVQAAWLRYRWRARRKTGRSARVRVADPARYLAALDDAGGRNVVMRFFDEVPEPHEAQGYEGDVDVLVDDGAEHAASLLAAEMAGPVRVEFRGVSGKLGLFHGMPYLPPVLAEEVLAARVRHERGFPVPALEHRLPLLMFHVCYHKAEGSGLKTGVGLPTGRCERDYAENLRACARETGGRLPEPITLQALHEELERTGWDMQLDLLVRWPRQTPWIQSLIARGRERLDALAKLCPELIVFVLRDDLEPDLRALAVERLRGWFDVLEEGALDEAQRLRCLRHLRGGAWIGHHGRELIGPAWYVVCHDRTPQPVTDEKYRAAQPHVTNSRVRLKFELRMKLRRAAKASGRRLRYALHSSDNVHEALHFLEVIYGDGVEEKLRGFAARLARPDGGGAAEAGGLSSAP